MNILILGAGQVGSTVAYSLAREEDNNITVVDRDPELLAELQDRLDIRTVRGYASHPDVLAQAGADAADMVIALTPSDETNMIACQICYSLFHIKTKIARVRATQYLHAKEKLFVQEALPVDMIISPEELVTNHIKLLIQYPGAVQVLDFADSRVRMVAVRAYYGGALVGQEIRHLREHIPDVDVRVVALYRRGQAIFPDGNTVIEADDEVFILAPRRDIRSAINELRRLDRPVRRVLIAGGGNIGVRLAQALENTYQVKLIERNRERAREISEILDKTIVLHGEAADEELLQEENIEAMDVFCAVTNAEEANILSGMLAKRLGARKVMAIINRASYAELVHSGDIDIAISPQQITIGALLTHIRRGDIAKVHSLRRGAAEAIETVAHGDKKSSKVVGKAIEDIELPPGTTIGAIVRGDEVLMAHHDTVIQANDHVILFLVDRKHIPDVEQLFQVPVSFD
ncbi:MAG: Trk system potassium transporter TrkA [Gammaproteobacteria bacterium]